MAEYTLDVVDWKPLALALLQRMERFEVVGYTQNGGVGFKQNVWFVQDTYVVPHEILLPPFMSVRDANIARAEHILRAFINDFGTVTTPD